MSKGRWLTPDGTTPTQYLCRRLLIPDNPAWMAIVSGALLELTKDYNFEEFGAVTPEAIAAEFSIMFDRYYEKVFCMVGAIVAYPNDTMPDGLLICDGTTYERSDYPDLYDALHSSFQTSSTQFTVPDLRERFIIGSGSGYLLGDTGGEAAHVLVDAEMPAHNHTDLGHSHVESTALPNATTIGLGAPQPTAVPGIGTTGAGNANISTSGGGGAHENLPPYYALVYAMIAR